MMFQVCRRVISRMTVGMLFLASGAAIDGNHPAIAQQQYPEYCTSYRSEQERLVDHTLALNKQELAGMDSPDFDVMAQYRRKRQSEAYCSPIRQRIAINKEILVLRKKTPNCFSRDDDQEFQ